MDFVNRACSLYRLLICSVQSAVRQKNVPSVTRELAEFFRWHSPVTRLHSLKMPRQKNASPYFGLAIKNFATDLRLGAQHLFALQRILQFLAASGRQCELQHFVDGLDVVRG